MATWKQLANDSFEAARQLHTDGHYRSAVSRAYYAVYSRVTDVLSDKTVFGLREGPNHDDLPDMLYDYCTKLSVSDRSLYSTVVYQLYQHRLTADYRPSQELEEAQSREVMVWVSRIMKSFEVVYG